MPFVKICYGIACRKACSALFRMGKNSYLVSFFKFKKRRKILKLSRTIREISLDGKVILDLPDLAMSSNENAEIFAPEIKLASRRIPFSEDLFNAEFDDPEDKMAVHRFVWVLVLLQENSSDESIEFCLHQIISWCSRYSEPDARLEFETYSICERLVSWLLFLMLVKGRRVITAKQSDTLVDSFRRQLLKIIRNLEYHGSLTNNHILNNARALYFCGSLLNIAPVAELGREILNAETNSIILNGVMLENSSHYQMLLTKSYLEIYFAARISQDQKMTGWLKQLLPKMLETCNAMQSRFAAREYPLFGDISPDSDPDWTLGYPFSSRNGQISKWHRLLNIDVAEFAPRQGHLMKAGGIQEPDNKANAWYYVEGNDFEVWVIGKAGIRCHGHNDSGSMVVFHKGKPVVVDLGLVNYRLKEPLALQQMSWEGHNTPLLDGMPPDIDRYSLLRTDIVASSFVLCKKRVNLLSYKLRYLGGFAELTRIIEITDSGLVVEDRVTGEGKLCSYESRWHIASDIGPFHLGPEGSEVMAGSNFKIAVDSLGRNLKVDCNRNKRSYKYGGMQDVATITVAACLGGSDRVKLNFTATQQ